MTVKRVLVVDDEEAIRHALSTLLQEKGYEVDTCASGGAGLQQLKEKAYSMILLDYNLPDMNGLAVAQEARKINKEIPIVFISAYGTTDVILRAVRLGAFDFIEKPIQSEDLLSAIDRWASMRKEAVGKTLEKIRKALSNES